MSELITSDGRTGILVSNKNEVYIKTKDGKELLIYSRLTQEQINSSYGEEIVRSMLENILLNVKGYMEIIYHLEDLLIKMKNENNYETLIITPDGKTGFLESEKDGVYIRTKDGKTLIYSRLTQEQINSFYGEEYVKAEENINNIQFETSNCTSIIGYLEDFLDTCKNPSRNDRMYSGSIIKYNRDHVHVLRYDNTSIDVITLYGTRMTIPYKEYELGLHYLDSNKYIPILKGSIDKWYDKLEKWNKEKNIAFYYLNDVIDKTFQS